PHLAGAGDVRIHRSLAQQPCVKSGIRGQIGSSRLQKWTDNLFEVVVLRQGESETDSSTQTLPVEGVGKVIVVQARLGLRGRGEQPEFTCAHGEQQGDHHLDASVGRAFAILASTPGLGPWHTCSDERAHIDAYIVAPVRARGSAAQTGAAAGGPRLRWVSLVDLPRDIDLGMVPEVLPDARDISHHGNAEVPKLCGRPYAREHEEVG